MTRPVAGMPAASAPPGQAEAPGGEFSRGRVWLVATLCGLLGLSLVLVALAVADKRVGVLAPLWGGGGPPTTQAAPPPPAPAPPAGEVPATEPAKAAKSAKPAEAAKKARARQTAPSAADQGSSDGDSSESDSDSFEPGGPPGYGPGHGWGQYDRNQRLAQEMMRYRMNAGYPEHHR
ncbi:MAG: hypothetical protein QOE32_7148 [Pseudonocardiales bacterium]|nr:hypothetical protein [Pseudonocardiales bacterium]